MRFFKGSWLLGGSALLICLVLILGGYYFYQTPEFSGSIEAEMTFTQEIYQIGDQMILTIQIKTEDGYIVDLPEITLPEGVEILEKSLLQKYKKRHVVIFTQRYYLTTWAPGEYVFEDLSVKYTTPTGEEQQLEIITPILLVESLLTEDAVDIRGLKPLAEVPPNSQLYYLIIFFVLVLGLLLYFWKIYRRRSKKVVIEELPPLSAHKIAQQRLNWLENSDLLSTGKIAQYFTELSEIVREYIEHRFSVRAREMTTEEFLTKAIHKLILEEREQNLLQVFLMHADLVKYARHIPEAEQITKAFRTVSDFIEQTKSEPTEEGGEKVV